MKKNLIKVIVNLFLINVILMSFFSIIYASNLQNAINEKVETQYNLHEENNDKIEIVEQNIEKSSEENNPEKYSGQLEDIEELIEENKEITEEAKEETEEKHEINEKTSVDESKEIKKEQALNFKSSVEIKKENKLDNIVDNSGRLGIAYKGYINNSGMTNWILNDNLAGTEGKGIGLNGIRIQLTNAPANSSVEYMVLKEEKNKKEWTEWISSGELAGFEQNGKSIYAIRIRLINLDNYSIEYRVHRRYQGWESCYLADGDIAGKQSIDSRIEGIKIRIVPKITRTPQVIYRGYIDQQGYQRTYSKDDLLTGTESQGIGLNGLKIELLYGKNNSGIEYQVLKDNGKNKKEWTDWIKNGELAGFEENGKNIYAIKIRLINLENYSVQYKIHRKYQGWEDHYVSDGETIGLEYSDSRIEGILIKIVPKIKKNFGVSYSGFIDKKGYQERVGSGALIGTEGKGIGLNGIKIELRHAPVSVGIEYQGYVQGIGWQDIKKEGQYVGNEKNDSYLYGIRIRLTNTKDYSVQYRVHRQYIGWENKWVSDGELAGVEDTSSKIEGIQIRIVPKIYHRIIKIEEPTEKYITGNNLFIKGWELSEEKDTNIKVYIDNQYIKTLKKVERQDILEKYVIEEKSILQNYGGIKSNLKPGFEEEIDISSIKKGAHVISIKVYSNAGKYLEEKSIVAIFSGDTYIGIDVSTYNGKIDWKKVKNDGINFAIIRIGYRGYESGKIVEDSKFKQNMEDANKAGIKLGVYFFSQAITTNEAIDEVDWIINTLNKYGYRNLVKYPIVIDTEYTTELKEGRADKLDKYTRTVVCKAFAEKVKQYGYTPCIYANKYWLQENIDMTQLNGYDVWLAHYINNAPFNNISDYKGRYSMWQYTSSGQVNGINGKVDLDISYYNYCQKD